MAPPTHTVESFDRVRYATAQPGEFPDYEARTSPDGSTALLLARRDDSDRPDLNWHDVKWARETTATWDANA